VDTPARLDALRGELAALARKRPGEISGGEGQRVARSWCATGGRRRRADPVVVDVWMIAPMTGAAGAVVALVTGLSLPVMLRSMRPEGLRAE
jgi:hypothetical protein